MQSIIVYAGILSVLAFWEDSINPKEKEPWPGSGWSKVGLEKGSVTMLKAHAHINYNLKVTKLYLKIRKKKKAEDTAHCQGTPLALMKS